MSLQGASVVKLCGSLGVSFITLLLLFWRVAWVSLAAESNNCNKCHSVVTSIIRHDRLLAVFKHK